MNARVLVAGVGNVFLGDDGFGVEVVRRLAAERFADDVVVADFGIRGVHLAHELLNGYEELILIDAASHGETPGTVFVLEPDLARPRFAESGFLVDAHGLDPELVLRMLADLGGVPPRVRVVACEPAEVEERMGLSPAVAAAVERAVGVVRSLLETNGENEA